MISINEPMKKEILQSASIQPQHSVPISNITSSGFIETAGCFLIASLAAKAGALKPEFYFDLTAYEATVNSIHIGDFEVANHLAFGVGALLQVLGCWRDENDVGVLRGYLSLEENDATVKFHVVREEGPLMPDDLDLFSEPILMLDSQERLIVDSLGALIERNS